ncbi:MAG: RIP metalloprotease RseP [Acidobacteria bacterium]|nr:RIP metalloprotease RseP [Acidobacteriota bacterium]
MYNFATSIIGVMIVLGIMVFIHELGHFLAAKYFGIRVETFSIGFGKRLWGFERGGTDYRLSVLPFGGYVKMSGENPDDPTSGAPDEFQMKPRWQRFIVAIMGPAMNIVLSIVLLTGLYMFRYQKPAYAEGPAVIGYIAPDSSASKAGLLPGDRITRLDEMENPGWTDIEIEVASSANQTLTVAVDRDGAAVNATVVPQPTGRSQIGDVGWAPRMSAKIQAVEADLPAGLAGMQAGDVLTEINGQTVTYWPAVSELVQKNQGQPLQITYARGTEMITAQMTPVPSKVNGESESRWRIGVQFTNEVINRQLSFSAALGESLTTNKKFALLIFEFLGKIFSNELSPRTLEGPIGIARLSGAALRQSFADLISLMAAISLNLGIFNLLPIPVLDGGMILMLLIEGTIRRDLNLKLKERVTQVGFAFLMLIAVFTIYNDIVKSLPERFEKFLP